MLHYFYNVTGSLSRAKAVCGTVQSQFKQFEQYLKRSKTALERKNVSAKWKPVDQQNLAELEIIGGLYKYEQRTIINIINNKKGFYKIESVSSEPDFDEKMIFKYGNEKGDAVVTEDIFKNKIIYLKGIETKQFDIVRWGFADVKLNPMWICFEKNTMLNGSSGADYKIINIDNDNITIEGNLKKDEKISYNDKELNYKIIESSKPPFDMENLIDKDENIFYSEKTLSESWQIKNVKHLIKKYIDFDNIVNNSNPQEKFEREKDASGITIILKDDKDKNKIVRSGKLKFKIIELQKNNADKFKIQLIEIDKKDTDDELYALPRLRYFFDDDAMIKEEGNKNNTYYVDSKFSNDENNQIVLKKDSKSGPYCLPTENSELKVIFDGHQIECQMKAIDNLKWRPHKDHEMLLRLFEKKGITRWKKPEIRIEIGKKDWIVLTEERSGCEEQREFVKKALNTPDFAILEGPPGSGKTTVILELICQIISRRNSKGEKMRVLLCGSTHVAIDNVLQRIIEEGKNGLSLREKYEILPVRIGKRGDRGIEDYKIDSLLGFSATDEQKKLKEKLLLDAANLVCGTTMGIVGHPKFSKQRNIYEPIVPEFDFLIIDECSKTTFQEYLVPALYAKKWILSGDVMQLSPFTDQESIEFNFQHMFVNGKELDNDIQTAVYYLEKLKNCFYWKKHGKDKEYKKYYNNFILPCKYSLAEKIIKELIDGRIEKFIHKNNDKEYKKLFICITERELPKLKDEIKQKQIDQIILHTPATVNFLELTAANLIIVEDSIMKTIIDKLPATHAILLRKNWETMPHAFYHNAYCQKQGRFGLKLKYNEIFDSFKIVKEINEDLCIPGGWAKQIAWRLNSSNQLRLAKEGNKKGKDRKDDLIEEIDDYTPCSIKINNEEAFENACNIIFFMSFPSILESLVKGIKSRNMSEMSTITNGFDHEDLNDRRTTLKFQHRMHPDISAHPRDNYYKGEVNALEDLKEPKHIKDMRNWNYTNDNKYFKRSMWINVSPEPEQMKGRQNKNIFEVEAIINHLEKFLAYAVKHKQPEGKKWEVACLTFYNGQEELLREGGKIFSKNIGGIRSLPGIKGSISSFKYNENGENPVNIKLRTVDNYQGHEADIVFLSMTRTRGDGFLDNPNRLNVSITRAKFQLLIFGKHDYFLNGSRSLDLKALAKSHENSLLEWRIK